MDTLPKVQDKGEITLPSEVREAAGIQPGDIVEFRVIGPGKVELTTRQSINLDYWIAKYGGGPPITDWSTFVQEAEAELGDEIVRRIRDGIE